MSKSNSRFAYSIYLLKPDLPCDARAVETAGTATKQVRVGEHERGDESRKGEGNGGKGQT
jgi:hypothetical protein